MVVEVAQSNAQPRQLRLRYLRHRYQWLLPVECRLKNDLVGPKRALGAKRSKRGSNAQKTMIEIAVWDAVTLANWGSPFPNAGQKNSWCRSRIFLYGRFL